jgi:hypothetical protein
MNDRLYDTRVVVFKSDVVVIRLLCTLDLVYMKFNILGFQHPRMPKPRALPEQPRPTGKLTKGTLIYIGAKEQIKIRCP